MTGLRALLVAVLAAAAAVAIAADGSVQIMVQTSLAAGLSHHDARSVWEHLRVGERLELVRETDNPHDPNAVRLDWHGHALGYIPRTENESVARQLDRGNALEARITAIGMHRNHRRKLEVEIYLGM
jgi:hypothetical protein